MGMTLKTERYVLPGSIDGIGALIREILNGGSVKRIELDNDDAFVRAQRWVDDDLAEDAVTWDGALRNVPNMLEYYSEEAESFQVLVDMMLLAQEEGLRPIGWATGTGGRELLKTWLETDRRGLPVREITELLGVPVHQVRSLPDETLILGCAKYATSDPTDLSFAIKTVIDLRRTHGKSFGSTTNRIGDRAEEHSDGTKPLALTTGGLRKVVWRPEGNSR